MTADLILAIDQGTTGTTCLLITRQLEVLARVGREFPQHFPRPGWVEHDPDELFASVETALSAVLEGVDPARIAAIGITNQRETSVVWERASGRPIHRALVWQDRRTALKCAELREGGHADRVKTETGLELDPYFSATKLAWTLDHVDGARAAAERGDLAAGTIDTYLLWRLTAGAAHKTEPSNACRTLLWPLAAKAKGAPAASGDGGWDPALCELFRVPMQILPEVHSCNALMGSTVGVRGLPDGIPIHGIAGDQQSALFGQACFARGQAKSTYGTGAFVMLNTAGDAIRSRHGLLTSVAWQLGGETTYCLEGSAFMAGAVVQWLRDGLEMIPTAADVEALAASVPDSGGVVLVPAHTGLGAPHWRPDARGLICGLSRGSTKAHLARAALEGIALQVTDLLEAMAADLGGPVGELRVDGGAAANDLLMQIQANLLAVPIVRPRQLETTAMGAAFLAGLGVGLWSDRDEVVASWKEDRSFQPQSDPETLAGIDDLRNRWRSAVEKA